MSGENVVMIHYVLVGHKMHQVHITYVFSNHKYLFSCN